MNYKTVGDYVEIYIQSLKFGEHTVYIDTEDLPRVLSRNWWVMKSKDKFYCHGYDKETGNRHYSLHRFIMGGLIGIDHKDHNGLNNRKSNLRVASGKQNSQNRRIYKTNKSGFKGISYDKWDRNDGYRAAVKVNGKTISGQRFKNPLLAAYQYNALASHYYGEFALLHTFTEQQQMEIKNDPKYEYAVLKIKDHIDSRKSIAHD